jgi:hypothetical protein
LTARRRAVIPRSLPAAGRHRDLKAPSQRGFQRSIEQLFETISTVN